jgi:hypothetical protein
MKVLSRLGKASGDGSWGRTVKFNFFVIFGILLAVLGLAALLHPEIKMPAKREVLQIGPTKVPVETRRIVSVPPVVGGLIIVCGAGVVFLGARKS